MVYSGEAHNSDELKNKLFRVGGWLGGGLVGEAGNKTNSALLSWGLAELGNYSRKISKQCLLTTRPYLLDFSPGSIRKKCNTGH